MWFGLSQRSVDGDEAISILSAQAVLTHGYPRLPSGLIYHRGQLPAYLVAGSIGAFGLNDLAIMLPSLLCSLGSLFLAYLIGRDLFNRPAVGVAAAAMLTVLQAQVFYATSARMYMTLQFCSVLAVYSAWRGYVQGRRAFQWTTILAIAGAIFSHQQGGAVLVAVPLSVLLVRWRMGRDRPSINYALACAGLVLLCAAFWFATVYQLPGELTRIAGHSGLNPEHAGVNVNLAQWYQHALELEQVVPLGLLLWPTIVFLALRSLRERRSQAHHGIAYLSVFFLLSAIALMANVNIVHWRLWVWVLPAYILLLTLSAVTIVEWLGVTNARAYAPPPRPAVWRAGLVGWALVVLVVVAVTQGPTRYLQLMDKAYLPPCRGSCSPDVEAQYAAFRPWMANDDFVVSSNPKVTNYYLGRVDGYLRERQREDGQFTSFESPTDEYLGIPLIDTQDELEELRRSPRRVWILVDHKAMRFSSRHTRDFLSRAYAKHQEHDVLTVYVNSVVKPSD
ncbi:MAG: glycosyltransferase family 39 protein [Candidatus Omnitrophica bacterium]|nr:glycosyltransferase family 39 protein [Candidatus Omnitrophota bacterium]